MRAILRFLGSRWFLTFIGVVLLSLLVWWFGPYLPFMESWIVRALVIAVMVLLWAATNLLLTPSRSASTSPSAVLTSVPFGTAMTRSAPSPPVRFEPSP